MGGSCSACRDTSDSNMDHRGIPESVIAEWRQSIEDNDWEAANRVLSRNKGVLEVELDIKGRRAIHIAAVNVDGARMLSKLLHEGLDINAIIPQSGNTALHEASVANNVDCILCLLEAFGCDKTIANADGMTAEQLATSDKAHSAFKYNTATDIAASNDTSDAIGLGEIAIDADAERHRATISVTLGRAKSGGDMTADQPINYDFDVNIVLTQFKTFKQDQARLLKVWNKLTDSKKELRKKGELTKLVSGIIILCLKKNDRKATTPNREGMKKIAEKIYTAIKLSSADNTFRLTKDAFVQSFDQRFATAVSA